MEIWCALTTLRECWRRKQRPRFRSTRRCIGLPRTSTLFRPPLRQLSTFRVPAMLFLHATRETDHCFHIGGERTQPNSKRFKCRRAAFFNLINWKTVLMVGRAATVKGRARSGPRSGSAPLTNHARMIFGGLGASTGTSDTVAVGKLATLGRGDKRANGEMRPKPSDSVAIFRHPSAATYVVLKGTPSWHLQNETKMISFTRRR